MFPSIVVWLVCFALLFPLRLFFRFSLYHLSVLSIIVTVLKNPEKSRRLFPKKKPAGSFHKAKKEEVVGSLYTWPEPRWGETQSLSLDTPTFGRVDVDGPSSEYDLSIPAEVRAEIAF